MTLHWFVHPQWFDDLGGWLEAKNIQLFVDWAELAFKHFGAQLALACMPLNLPCYACVAHHGQVHLACGSAPSHTGGQMCDSRQILER